MTHKTAAIQVQAYIHTCRILMSHNIDFKTLQYLQKDDCLCVLGDDNILVMVTRPGGGEFTCRGESADSDSEVDYD